jgi:hypothetical protein
MSSIDTVERLLNALDLEELRDDMSIYCVGFQAAFVGVARTGIADSWQLTAVHYHLSKERIGETQCYLTRDTHQKE